MFRFRMAAHTIESVVLPFVTNCHVEVVTVHGVQMTNCHLIWTLVMGSGWVLIMLCSGRVCRLEKFDKSMDQVGRLGIAIIN